MAWFSCDVIVENLSSGPKTRRQNGNPRLMSWLFCQEERRACDQQQRQLSRLVLGAARGVKILKYILLQEPWYNTVLLYMKQHEERPQIHCGVGTAKRFSLETAEAMRVTAVWVCDAVT
jgi:hypothetical protein